MLTFRSSGPELDVLGATGHPFYRLPWGADAIAVVLAGDVGRDVDRVEVEEPLIDSYCVLAPRKLVALVDRPAG